MNTSLLTGKKIFVVSPHLDDALLSLGCFIDSLQGIASVTLVNVFTRGTNGPYTVSAKQFLRYSGATDAETLFNDRIDEDTKAAQQVGAQKLNLGLVDALFRTYKKPSFMGKIIPEFSHVYPTYRFHVTKKVNPNDSVFTELASLLKKSIPEDAIVIAPFGVGGHVDHLIVRRVCESIYPQILYYGDFPYTYRGFALSDIPQNYSKVELPVNLPKKQSIVNAYLSQVNGLFTNGIVPEHRELLIVPSKLKSIYES